VAKYFRRRRRKEGRRKNLAEGWEGVAARASPSDERRESRHGVAAPEVLVSVTTAARAWCKKSCVAACYVALRGAWDSSTRNGIHAIRAQYRLKVRQLEPHDGIPAAAEFVVRNASLEHVAVQRARGDMKKFRRLGFVEQRIEDWF
jgi:hypothetical protein